MAEWGYGYGRKSLTRWGVKSDLYSGRRQSHLVERWFEANNVELRELFLDNEGRRSGRTARRPGWQALLRALETSTPDFVVCEAVDRAGREMELLVVFAKEMERRGIRLIFVEDHIDFSNPLDRSRFYNKAAVAEEESELLSRRMKRHVTWWRSERHGYWGTAPFGTVRDNEGKLKPDESGFWYRPGQGDEPPLWMPEECSGAVLRTYHGALTRLFDLYVAEEGGFAGLADMLNLEGWRYRGRDNEPREWRADDIRRCVHNWRLYVGTLTRGRARRGDAEVVARNVWPPIVDPAVAYQAADLLDKRGAPNRGRPHARFVYPLTPILHCARCKKQLTSQLSRNDRRTYRHVPKGDCPADTGSVDAVEVEQSVQAILSLFCASPALEAELERTVQLQLNAERERSEATFQRTRLAQLKRQRDRLKDLYVMEEIDQAEYLKRKIEFNRQIEELQEACEEPAAVEVGAVMARLRTLDRLLQDARPQEQKELLAGFLARIEVDPDTRQVYYWPKEWARPFFRVAIVGGVKIRPDTHPAHVFTTEWVRAFAQTLANARFEEVLV